MDVTKLLQFDAEHVWHPYSSATHPATVRMVESASGVHLQLAQPDDSFTEVIDAMSSWWCAIHGYNVPELNEAAIAQLGAMSHVMFGGLTHEPAISLAQKLVTLAPAPEANREKLTRVFLADSGSVSVEVALKLALQKFAMDDVPRRKIFTLRGGYHGDTLHPMSVCDPDGGMHALWRGTLPEQVFGPLPPAAVGDDLTADPDELARWKHETTSCYEQFADGIAAVILEPVLQGAGGMRVYDPECVRYVAALARKHGALVIFDEIATGFGRTGTYWAADRVGITPDILTVGKALTGGYLTLAGVLCTNSLAHDVSSSTGALMHGPTFMGNPLACSIALASLNLLDDERLAHASIFADKLEELLAPLRDIKGIKDVRTIGAVGVVQLEQDVDVDAATDAALREGIWIRPFRDLIYTMPPYICTDDELATIARGIHAAARASIEATS